VSDAIEAQVAARTAEKESLAAELARQAPVIAEIEARLAAARRKVADVQLRATAIRNERAALENAFRRRVGTRSQGVEEANRLVRTALVTFARRAVNDASADLAPMVEELRRTDEAAAQADRAVRLHEAALASADQKQVMQGAIVAGVGVLLLLVLLFFPLIYRALVVTDPALPQ
jgi:hypothetical protein